MVPGGNTTDQLLYERTIIRPKTPYGMSDTEIALFDGLLWMRRMGWLMAEYTHGVSGAILETDASLNWDVTQWKDYLRGLNDELSGQHRRSGTCRYKMLPPGAKAVLPPEVAERYKPEYDMFLVALVAGDFGLPASEVGFTQTGALGASFHEGEEDILYRATTRLPGRELAREDRHEAGHPAAGHGAGPEGAGARPRGGGRGCGRRGSRVAQVQNGACG